MQKIDDKKRNSKKRKRRESKAYRGALLEDEGSAMVAHIQEGKRIPNDVGYVWYAMSGSQCKRNDTVQCKLFVQKLDEALKDAEQVIYSRIGGQRDISEKEEY
ncbi:hypothetical protein Glove_213g97 [Diversispora epigaea]|uniref:Uncharacterized protein n=1 Tax=Diversispora epigaea TaxID=1348612 RepID=A0A397IRD7_9GLOM|nr:hypothetical protein Glove_213g97 [Diversispora epigaea]